MRAPSSLTALWILTAVAMAAALPYLGSEAGTDPVGPGYNTANRVYAVPLVLLAAVLVMLARRVRLASAVVGSVAGCVVAAGAVLEFEVGAWLGATLSGDVARLGLPPESLWWGSNVGFGMYGFGVLVLTVATVVAGVRAYRRGRLNLPVVVALGATGPLVLAGFAAKDSGAVAAGVVGVVHLVLWAVAAPRLPAAQRATVPA